MMHAGHRFVVTIFILLAFGMIKTPSSAETGTTPAERQLWLQEISRQHGRQDYAGGLESCRRYLELYPGDEEMLYNQACLESLLGDADAAVLSLRQALDAGFGDLRRLQEDPDLAGLAGHAGFTELVAERSEQLARLSRERALNLDLGVWSEPITLTVEDLTALQGDFPGPLATGAENPPHLRLRWLDEGLEVELTATGGWVDLVQPDTAAPWAGGPGLVATLAVPDGTSSYESAQSFVFACGADKVSAAAARYVALTGSWQPLPSESIDVTFDDDRSDLILRCTLSWSALRPFHPLVDPLLGVNIDVRTIDALNPLRAAWLKDPAGFRPESEYRRYVPVGFNAESVQDDTFLGKVSDSVTGAEPLTLELLAVSSREGRGSLSIDFQNTNGRSLLQDGPRSQGVKLDRGVNRLQHEADFSILRSGNYLIRTELTFPDGTTAVWSTPILHLTESWFGSLADRAAGSPPTEKATLRYWEAEIRQVLSEHKRRQDPTMAAGMLLSVTTMLDRLDRAGTLLPEKGIVALVAPDASGPGQASLIYVPAGHTTAGGLNPVVLLTDPRLPSSIVLDRIARSYDHEGYLPHHDPAATEAFPVYIIPQLPAAPDSSARTAAVNVVDWARTYFGAETCALAGLDGYAGVALELAASEPRKYGSLVIFAGGSLGLRLYLDREAWLDRITPAPAGLPVTWLDFPSDRRRHEQALDSLAEIRAAGWPIERVESVRGGLSLTQTADRLVLWAEDLR